MGSKVRKIVAGAICSAMLMSMASCAKDYTEDVIKISNYFVSAVAKLDEKKIYSKTDVNKNDRDTSLFVYTDDVEGKVIKEMIIGAINGEIIEDSIEIDNKKKTATVDAVFTLPDYEKVFSETTSVTENQLITEIASADKAEVEVTLELAMEEENWLVTNAPDVLESLFAPVLNSKLPPLINYDDISYKWNGEWDSYEKGVCWYDNVSEFSVEITGIDVPNISYKIHNSDGVITEGEGSVAYFDEAHDFTLDEWGHIPEGIYYVTFMAGETEIDFCKAEVTSSEEVITIVWDNTAFKIQESEAWFNDVTDFGLTVYDVNASAVYYTIELDGELLYKSQEGDYSVDADKDYGIEVNLLDFLMVGDYVITFYDGDKALNPVCIAHVTTTLNEVPGPDGCIDSSTKFYDEDFVNKIEMCGWQDLIKGEYIKDHTFEGNVNSINYMIYFYGEYTETIYYGYWYVEDADGAPDYSTKADYDSSSLPNTIDDQSAIAIQCLHKEPGYYYLIAASDPELNNILFSSVCIIEEE